VYFLKAGTVEPEKQPLLGNAFALNNKVIFTKRDVTLTAVAMERLSKHVYAETNAHNNGSAVFCAVRAEGL
jgi:hypothetical protein